MQLETVAPATFFTLVPWVVLFPLLGLLINLVIGRKLGEKVVGTIASAASGLAFVIACMLFISLQSHPEAYIHHFADWIKVGSLAVNWDFRVDTLSVTMMLVVSGVGTLIHIYAIGYMHEDVRLNEDPGRFTRFFIYMNLFIMMMMILVSAESYLMTFVGWEGVGLCSYLLIGFWYEKGKDGIGNAVAAKKAFITNRIGDFGFLIAMFMIFLQFGSLNFTQVFQGGTPPGDAGRWVVIGISLFLLLAVTGKSAQLPLFVWLPDAMAGPTPVSALIHAATMVTGGVYLVARSAPIFAMSPVGPQAVAWVGTITALFAATIAIGQYDIKKVLAYSTISQLGFMVAAVGMGAYTAGMFHLITHAFFKALLFLSAGSVIQGVEFGHHHLAHADHSTEFDPQDMRNMGGLRTKMKTTFWVYLIGALALSGIAPLAGFFSKDEILAFAFTKNPVMFGMLLLAAFFTAFYMTRQVWMVFFAKPRTEAAAGAKENPPLMTIPLLILALLSIICGLINLPGVESLGLWLEHSISGMHAGEFNLMVAGVSLVVAITAILIGWLFYGRKASQPGQTDPLKKLLGPLFTAFERKWWVDEIYDFFLLQTYKDASGLLAEPVDQIVIDGTANGLGKFAGLLSRGFGVIQNGLVRSYALMIFIGAAAILGYLIFR
jgi:NADH-quinone oxidoreductase subunit L